MGSFLQLRVAAAGQSVLHVLSSGLTLPSIFLIDMERFTCHRKLFSKVEVLKCFQESEREKTNRKMAKYRAKAILDSRHKPF